MTPERVIVRVKYKGPCQTDEQHFYWVDGSLGGPACLPVCIMGLLPQHDYRVEWWLAEDGEYAVVAGYTVRRYADRADRIGRSAAVCFLPLEWVGKRVSRRVLPWA
jgi:hypothetical protein